MLVGRAEKGKEVATVRFAPVVQPMRYLEELIALFQRGRTRPLPLFPDTTRAYVAACLKQATFEKARTAACKVFVGDRFPGDGDDANVRLLYPDVPAVLRDDAPSDPAAELFAVATTVFRPLLDHREEVE